MVATPTVKYRKDHRLAWTVIVLTVLVFAAGIMTITLHLREVIRQQLFQQDGEVLHAATLLQQLENEAGEMEGEDPADQLEVILETSKLRGVVALRMFNRDGKYIGSFPLGVRKSRLRGEHLGVLKSFKPVSEFRENVSLTEIYPNEEDVALPFIHAYVPLKAREAFIGAVEFILDGSNVAAAMERGEKNLYRYAFLIFAVSASITALVLMLAFKRLERANELLLERTQRLVQANHELTMAAKTSAIGAVTAHLLHDLKNPLFGLQCFVSARPGAGEESEQEWSEALQSTRRMQTLINDVVRILREEETSTEYELACDEILQLVKARHVSAARERKITLEFSNDSAERLPNRHGNLVVLILSNLVQNAMQALGENGRVEVECRQARGELIFRVSDTGPGLPEALMNSLFQPKQSGKEGGTGLGLAISKQLANHLGAELVLTRNSPAGAQFELKFKTATVEEAGAQVLSRAI